MAARTTRPRKKGQVYERVDDRAKKGDTFVAQRDYDGRVKGVRYPLTASGVSIAWRRLRKKAKLDDFRFHDFRHNFATKLLRESGNLKLVSRALNHSKLETTMRYAHVLDQDIADALEEVQGGLRGKSADKQSQKKSRTKLRSAS